MPVHFDPGAKPPTSSLDAGRAPELDLIRVRILLVVAATFVMALLGGGMLVALGIPGLGSRMWLQLGGGPPLSTVAFGVAFALEIALVAWMTRHVIAPAEDLAASRRDLGVMYESARSRALEDSLTGLANHRAFQEEFESLLALSVRQRTDLALLFLDIDDFKIVNDSAGHAVGDDLLIEMGRLLRGQLRASDRAFRIGGDEFAILMPHTDADNARIVANRLLAACVEPRPSELTERDAVQDIDRLRRVLGRLQATGLRIAADDVGAGNAGLRLLSQIQFDIVKLDLSLVQDGAQRETSLAVVRSLADLAARWGAMVIAEGLETPAQLRLIRSLPITAAQGYLLGRPAAVPDQRSINIDALESGLHDATTDSAAPGIGEFQRRIARRRASAGPGTLLAPAPNRRH